MKILIAYDGSEGADAALDDLPRAGLPGRAEALVVVTDVWLTPSRAEYSRAVARRRMLSAETSSFAPASREVEEERALGREAMRRIRALFPARSHASIKDWKKFRRAEERVNQWGRGDWDVPYQREAEALEQCFRIAESCAKAFQRAARQLANIRLLRAKTARIRRRDRAKVVKGVRVA